MSTKRPNIVYVFPDEFRQQALGFLNQDPVVTPNLNAFARESLVLTQAVSNCPICSPYRAMLFTGKYPAANGVVTNCYNRTIKYGVELKDDERCLTDVLHDSGYSQGYIGKLHLHLPKEENIQYTEGWRGEPGKGSFWDAYTPPERRHSIDFWHSYGCCDQHLTPHYWIGDAAVNERTDINEWSVKHETDVAIEYIRNSEGEHRDPEKPFALFVAFNPPHMPFDQVPDEYKTIYQDKKPADLLTRPNVPKDDDKNPAINCVADYFAAVTGVDEQFGRILESLQNEGLADDTIVIFTSDHGDMMGSHGKMGKGLWYDESILVPFIIRYPGHIQPGQDDIHLGAPDIMPTLLGLTGLNEEIPAEVQGSDYSEALLGNQFERPKSSFYFNSVPQDNNVAGRRGIRTDRYTFVISKDPDEVDTILHDNLEDPYQMRNIAYEKPEIVESLSKELDSWLRKTDDPWLDRISTVYTS